MGLISSFLYYLNLLYTTILNSILYLVGYKAKKRYIPNIDMTPVLKTSLIKTLVYITLLVIFSNLLYNYLKKSKETEY